MQDKLILIFVKHNKTDYKAAECKSSAVNKGSAVKICHKFRTVYNSRPEGLDYAVKRIYFKKLSLPRAFREAEPVYCIYNRRKIEKKQGENVVKVFNILEKDVESAENKTHTERQNKKHCYGKHCKDYVEGKVYRVIVYHLEEKNDPRKYGKRYNKGDEGGKHHRKRIDILRNINLLDNRSVFAYRFHGSFRTLSIKFVKQSAGKKVNGIIYNLRGILAEKIAENNGKNYHCKKRLKK